MALHLLPQQIALPNRELRLFAPFLGDGKRGDGRVEIAVVVDKVGEAPDIGLIEFRCVGGGFRRLFPIENPTAVRAELDVLPVADIVDELRG